MYTIAFCRNGKIAFIVKIKGMIRKTPSINANNPPAVVMVLYESGCRCGEFLSLRVKDVIFDDYGAVLIIHKGKTGARRRRLIDSIPELRLWLNHHPLKDDPKAPLWVNLKWGKAQDLGPSGVDRRLKLLAEKAGIKKRVHPHLFRHSVFTKLAQNFSESELRIMGGWSSRSDMIDTYVHLAAVDIDDKYMKLKGVKKKEEVEENPLAPRNCPRCDEENTHSARFCNRCSLPLDQKTAFELEKKKEKLAKFREELYSRPIEVRRKTDFKEVILETIKEDPYLIKQLKEIIN